MMKIRESLALLALIFFLATQHCVSQTTTSVKDQIKFHALQAEKFLRERQPDLAIPEFRAIVSLDPTNADAQANLGVLLFFQKEYAEAIPPLRTALKLQPGLLKIQMLLGMAEKRTGHLKAARKDLKSAFSSAKEEKSKIQAGMELIEIYSGARDLHRAASVVDALDVLYPTNPYVIYASYRIHSDLAEQAMLSLALVAPNSALMHQVMAHELELHGHKAGAIEQYRLALKLDPHLPGLHFELAELLNSSTDPALHAQAKNEYEAALAADPFDEKAERRLGELAARAGDLKTASADYSRALKLQPNDSKAMTDFAEVLLGLHQRKKALALLKHSLALNPTSAAAHYRLSALDREMGMPDDAKQQLKEFMTYNKDWNNLHKVFETMRVEVQEAERHTGHYEAGYYFNPVY